MNVWAPTHTQVLTSRGVWADIFIAPLLEVLWLRGFETEFSCQGSQKELAYIGFNTADDAERFAGAAPFAVCFPQGRFVDFRPDAIGYLTQLWGAEVSNTIRYESR